MISAISQFLEVLTDGQVLVDFIMHSRSTVFKYYWRLRAHKNSYSHVAAEVILPHIVAEMKPIIFDQATQWPDILECELIAFGGLPHKNAQVNLGVLGGIRCMRK